jgi:hypothetical protein
VRVLWQKKGWLQQKFRFSLQKLLLWETNQRYEIKKYSLNIIFSILLVAYSWRASNIKLTLIIFLQTGQISLAVSDNVQKIILVGSCRAGKTALVIRFVQGGKDFSNNYLR